MAEWKYSRGTVVEAVGLVVSGETITAILACRSPRLECPLDVPDWDEPRWRRVARNPAAHGLRRLPESTYREAAVAGEARDGEAARDPDIAAVDRVPGRGLFVDELTEAAEYRFTMQSIASELTLAQTLA